MALLIAILVAIVVRGLVLQKQVYQRVEQKVREAYQVVMSGGLRGRVVNDSVYLSSGIPVKVYSIAIHNGTTILWSNPSRIERYPKYTVISMPLIEITNFEVAVYRGSLANLVEQCKAWVVLVTDRGLFKWCSTVVVKYVNSTEVSIAGFVKLLGDFDVHYVGNITFYTLYLVRNVTASGDASSSSTITNERTTLYPIVLFYNSKFIDVAEKWVSGTTRVNITLRNIVTGDTAWLLFDVANGSVVSRRTPTNSFNSYYVILWYSGGSAVKTMQPISIGGIDVFVFTVYYSGNSYYLLDLFSMQRISIYTGSATSYTVSRDVRTGDVADAIKRCYGVSADPSRTGASYVFSIYTSYIQELYIAVVNTVTKASTSASVKALAVSMNAVIYRNPYEEFLYGKNYYTLELFRTSISSPIAVAYSVSHRNDGCSGCSTSASSTNTSARIEKLCCGCGGTNSGHFLVKAEGRIALPSGTSVPIGVLAYMRIANPQPPQLPPATPVTTTAIGGGYTIFPAWIYERFVVESLTSVRVYAYVYTTENVDPNKWRIEWRIYRVGESNPEIKVTYPLQRVSGRVSHGLGGYIEIPVNGTTVAYVYRLTENGQWEKVGEHLFRWG
jgi:hypothetical protein